VRPIRFRRHGSFSGGIDLPDEKQATLHAPIESAPHANRLLLPLKPCGRSVAELIVRPGERVEANQLLAEAADETGTDVYAPLGGTVGEVEQIQVADRDGFLPQRALELTDLDEPGPIRQEPADFDWARAEPEELCRRLGQGGLTTFGRRTQPLGIWLDRARRAKCRVLVVNGMENQPYVTAEHAMLRLCADQVVRGMAILARALEVESCVLAVDNRRTEDYRGLIEPTRRHDVQRISLHNKYPIGADHVLVKVLTGMEVPVGGGTLDLQMVVVAPPTCLAVYRWVACSLPSTHRVVTVSGDRSSRCGNFWVPLGMECGALAAETSRPVIHGGPMFGTVLPDRAVVSASTDALLALDRPEPPIPSPCVRCGWCTDHCPARLNVSALNDAFELGDIAFADRAGALACVECGLCSYVCPARLPLSQRVRRLKRNLFQLRHRAAVGGGKRS
jgi:electron transport complex protein RnfC